MADKTHFKKLINPKYMGTHSLNPGEERIVTIEKVVSEKVTNVSETKDCAIMYFVGEKKPMICNVKNYKIISKLYNSRFVEDWVGKKIQLFVTTEKIFGVMDEVIRVRPFAPGAKLPVLTKESPAYNNAVEHMKKGGAVTDIEKRYQLTEEIKKELEAAYVK